MVKGLAKRGLKPFMQNMVCLAYFRCILRPKRGNGKGNEGILSQKKVLERSKMGFG